MNSTDGVAHLHEQLAFVIANMLTGLQHVAVGAASPIPAMGALLAREWSQGQLRVSLLGSRRHNFFTSGGVELFDCAAQGRIDAFFLGGAQIDGSANINLVGIGEYPRCNPRFPGSFGSSFLYFMIPRVILFTPSHSRRVLVPKVDFISAPGTSPDQLYRRGAPYALITNKCVFKFDRQQRRFRLNTLHRGHMLSEVREHTGFEFEYQRETPMSPEPDKAACTLLRGPVLDLLREVYPRFVQRCASARHE